MFYNGDSVQRSDEYDTLLPVIGNMDDDSMFQMIVIRTSLLKFIKRTVILVHTELSLNQLEVVSNKDVEVVTSGHTYVGAERLMGSYLLILDQFRYLRDHMLILKGHTQF